MKRSLLILMLLTLAFSAFGQLIINEIDYDQPGTDAYEYIEIAGPAGTYSNVVIDLVNGNGGTSYKTVTLPSITLADESGGYGFYVVGVAAVTNVDYSTGIVDNWLQNGAPDGVQLAINGTIVDAVAYEGALNDLAGNAMEDVSLSGDDMWEGSADTSISRLGLDNSPWAVTAHTPGAINTGQILAADTNYPPVASAGADQLVFVNASVTLDGSASTDPNDNIAAYQWSMAWGTQVSPTLTNANTSIATFTAPATVQDFLFELIVTDSAGAISRDTVAIAVREEQDSKLIISEYIEGSSSNKALELYNLDSNSVDMSGYVVKRASNGGGWDSGSELVLSGTLAGNDVYVITNDGATDANITGNSDVTSDITWFNGNDALGLFLNDVLVDVFGYADDGSVNFAAAGIAEAAYNHTLIRKASIEAGNTDWASSAGTDEASSEWEVKDIDYTSGLGSHTAGPVAYNFANATLTSVFPQAGSEIGITVDITPDAGVAAPSSVKIFYGTGGTQTNETDMWLESGTTYAGNIPAISTGNIEIDYYISAIGASETVNSGIFSFVLAGALTDISDIHSNIVSYEGSLKTIEGIITIGAGVLRDDITSCYIQDESGRGLNLYSYDLLPVLMKGTKVKLVGEVDLYYSTVEIKNFSYTVVSSGNDRPDAIAATPATANNDNYEGTLVTITGTLSEVQDFSSSKNMILTSGTDSAIVKVWPTTGIDPSSYSIGTEYSITGVGSKYSSEHQLLVGYTTDITDQVGICDDCLPESFAINKAYPNPFNPSTTIEFSLMDASDFEISIYNIAGQKMDILATGYAQPGVYTYVWNAADFTSGVYFVRLTADKNVATQKVVLIK